MYLRRPPQSDFRSLVWTSRCVQTSFRRRQRETAEPYFVPPHAVYNVLRSMSDVRQRPVISNFRTGKTYFNTKTSGPVPKIRTLYQITWAQYQIFFRFFRRTLCSEGQAWPASAKRELLRGSGAAGYPPILGRLRAPSFSPQKDVGIH